MGRKETVGFGASKAGNLPFVPFQLSRRSRCKTDFLAAVRGLLPRAVWHLHIDAGSANHAIEPKRCLSFATCTVSVVESPVFPSMATGQPLGAQSEP